MPYWNAALERSKTWLNTHRGSTACQGKGCISPAMSRCSRAGLSPQKQQDVLKSDIKSKNKPPGPGLTAPPQALTREPPACSKLSQHPGLASMAIPPRALTQPFLRAALTWAEPLCCSCTRCTPPACQSPSGPEAPSCYPAGRERLRAAPQLLLGGILTQPCTPSHKAPSPTSPRTMALAPDALPNMLQTDFVEVRTE